MADSELQACSPMKVDWVHKWLAIPYKGATVVLWGRSQTVPSGTVVEVCLLESTVQLTSQQQLHP